MTERIKNMGEVAAAVASEPLHIRLTLLRQAAGFRSRRALADKLGVSRRSVDAWESGDSEPSLSSAREIARVLGLSLITIVGGDALEETAERVVDRRQDRLDRLAHLDELTVEEFEDLRDYDRDAVPTPGGAPLYMTSPTDEERREFLRARPSHSVTLSYPPMELHPNTKAHRMAKARVAANYKFACSTITRATIGKLPVAVYAVYTEFWFRENRSRDHDNLIASLKAGLDGVAEGIDVDDSMFRIQTPTIVVDPEGKREVVVTLTQQDEESPDGV